MTVRQHQIESVLQRAISTVLQRKLSDPRIRGLVSVTSVRVSSDLRQATVLVSVLPEQHASCTIHGLRSAAGHIHARIKKSITTRNVQHLDFKLDDSLKKQAAISQAIAEGIQREDSSQ